MDNCEQMLSTIRHKCLTKNQLFYQLLSELFQTHLWNYTEYIVVVLSKLPLTPDPLSWNKFHFSDRLFCHIYFIIRLIMTACPFSS